MSRKGEIITGIDLGSSTIRIAVGQISSEGELHIVGLGEGPSEGIGKGVVSVLKIRFPVFLLVLNKWKE